jgi:hypothetical protein
MIRHYTDCLAIECDGCGTELYVGHVVPTAFEATEHYCDDCERPGCAECGVDLVDKPRFEAHDIQPEGQTWFRCAACSAAVIRDDLLHLINLDRGDAVRQFTAEFGLEKQTTRGATAGDDVDVPESTTAA